MEQTAEPGVLVRGVAQEIRKHPDSNGDTVHRIGFRVGALVHPVK